MAEWEQYQQLDKWKVSGDFFVWQYISPRSSMEGWHFSAAEPACSSLSGLLSFMATFASPCNKILSVATPRTMRVNPGAPWKSAAKLKLCFLSDASDAEDWELSLAEDTLSLTLGSTTIMEFREAIEGLPHWRDDYCLGPANSRDRNQAMWFWTRV